VLKKVFVIKHDGSRQLYDQQKVLSSILRSGVEKKQAINILGQVESKLYDGIPTKEIYRIVSEEIKKSGLVHPSRLYRLRELLAKMDPIDFEKFIHQCLNQDGFESQWNILVDGFCIDHQLDIIAKDQEGTTFYVEVKHKRNPHRDIGLGTVAEVWARFEDLKKGYKTGRNKYQFSSAWLFTNAKFSEHAKKYSRCKELNLTGWRYSLAEQGKQFEVVGLEKKIESLGMETINKILRKL
jgi:hypothetical protein